MVPANLYLKDSKYLNGLNGAELPAAHIYGAHNNILNSDKVPSGGVSVSVAPYQAMRSGDKVTLTWQGYSEWVTEDPLILSKTLTDSDIGHVLKWTIQAQYVALIENGHADISYQVIYSGSNEKTSYSSPLRLDIKDEEAINLLPVAIVPAMVGGVLNPADHPYGVKVEVPIYAGAEVGDSIMLTWKASTDAKSVNKSLLLDISNIDSRYASFHIEYEWLHNNNGASIDVIWQYINNSGVIARSDLLTVSLREPLKLPVPIVVGALSEGTGTYMGYLLAADAISGATIDIPEDAVIGDNDRITLNWMGTSSYGQYVAELPHADNSRRFHVPPSVVAANMNPNTAEHFEVYYQVTPTSEVSQKSIPFNLRIAPLDSVRYPTIQCLEAQGNNTLPLTSLPSAGATLRLSSWPFMDIGQQLTIILSGVPDIYETLRDGDIVTRDEYSNKQVQAKIPKSLLMSLRPNSQFTLAVQVSFNSGVSHIAFPNKSITIAS